MNNATYTYVLVVILPFFFKLTSELNLLSLFYKYKHPDGLLACTTSTNNYTKRIKGKQNIYVNIQEVLRTIQLTSLFLHWSCVV